MPFVAIFQAIFFLKWTGLLQIKELQICELAKVTELGMRLIFTMTIYTGFYFVLVKTS